MVVGQGLEQLRLKAKHAGEDRVAEAGDLG
jgi:hypothetical protein